MKFISTLDLLVDAEVKPGVPSRLLKKKKKDILLSLTWTRAELMMLW